MTDTMPPAIDEAKLNDLGVRLFATWGTYVTDRKGIEERWLRWSARDGSVLPTGDERAESERQRAESERQRADHANERAARLAERLRALGMDPEE